MTSSLGRLVRINLREVWDSESTAFTPWLAQEDNLKLLGETIGIELELESTEKNVGPFRADILCKDTATDHWVLIENQLESTDHKHLGQLLTYTAGLKAATIIWIAAKFTDEHRAALDWLNEATSDTFNFFGLEIELWKISQSPVAPKFNIISKPNDWLKRPSTASLIDITPIKQLQLEYWTAFMDYLRQKGYSNPPKPLPQHWMNFPVGRSNFQLQASVNTQKKIIGVDLSIAHVDAKVYFKILKKDSISIEKAMGSPLDWKELPHRKESRIALARPNSDIAIHDVWPQQHEWLHEKLVQFRKVFEPLVKKLKASDYVQEVDTTPEEETSE
jgi:Domain of unknown function (DUF4268)